MLSLFFGLGGIILMSFLNTHWVLTYLWLGFFMGLMFKLWYGELFGFCNILLGFGWDSLSGGLVVLTVWIFMLMILSSVNSLGEGVKGKILILLFISLFIMLVYVFLSLNLMMFYLMFEGSLIPTLLLIFGWGYQPERIQAGIYLLFYTLLASLPLLISLLIINSVSGTMSVLIMFFSGEGGFWWYLWLLMSNLAFLVKVPMYFMHLWLPKAHVEAPISGSMILAGVLLKLGGYGFIRFMSYFFEAGKDLSVFIMSIGLVGGIVSSVMCLRQVDLKSLIAYSSIGHMGLMLCGVGTFSSFGVAGAFSIMIGHGLCSSGLFCLANINYWRLSSRSMLLNKGVMVLVPSLSLWWFMLISSNIAAPPSLNLLGEVESLMGLLFYSKLVMVMFFGVSFFGAVYSLYLYGYCQHGSFFSGYYSFSGVLLQEYLLLLLHWIPLNIFLMSSDLLFL